MIKRTALPSAFFSAGIFAAGVCCVGLSFGVQQMEVRQSEEYSQEQFEKSKPALGELSPDIELKTLDGEKVSLSSYRGKNIVVIKAGYT